MKPFAIVVHLELFEDVLAIAGINELTGLIPVYGLPESVGEHYGQMRSALQKIGQPISMAR